jgi:hypothetical protein
MKKLAMALVAFTALTALPVQSMAAETTNPYGASTVDPAGPNEVILTITKGRKKVTFTTAVLSKLKSEKISIYEPFLKKRQSFTAIPLKTLFALAGISGKDAVSTVALNDYIYSNTASKFLAARAYLAIKREGKDIPYDQGGPIRIIYPDNSTWAKNLDAWNWSIASISVK